MFTNFKGGDPLVTPADLSVRDFHSHFYVLKRPEFFVMFVFAGAWKTWSELPKFETNMCHKCWQA